MDELQQALLAQLAGDGGGAATLSLPDLVEQSMGDDPIAGPLAAALRRRQEVAAAARPEPEWAADPAVADVLERLYAELEELRERTRGLAGALGACARCWGENAGCPVCRGRGRPGGRAPHPVLFDDWVAPAIRRRYRNWPEPVGAGIPTPPGGPYA